MTHPTAALCSQLLAGVPESGTVQAGNLMALDLQRDRIQHGAFAVCDATDAIDVHCCF